MSTYSSPGGMVYASLPWVCISTCGRLVAGRGGKCAVKPYAVQRLAGGVFDEHIPHADVARSPSVTTTDSGGDGSAVPPSVRRFPAPGRTIIRPHLRRLLRLFPPSAACIRLPPARRQPAGAIAPAPAVARGRESVGRTGRPAPIGAGAVPAPTAAPPPAAADQVVASGAHRRQPMQHRRRQHPGPCPPCRQRSCHLFIAWRHRRFPEASLGIRGVEV